MKTSVTDEIATIDGAVTLMDAKFFDYRRYDLTKAGRYKVHKKFKRLRPYGRPIP